LPGKQNLDELERTVVLYELPGGESVIEIGVGFGRMGSCYVGKSFPLCWAISFGSRQDTVDCWFAVRAGPPYHPSSDRCKQPGKLNFMEIPITQLSNFVKMAPSRFFRESLCRGDISVHDRGRMDNLLKVHI
jgi:hypothetical protein